MDGLTEWMNAWMKVLNIFKLLLLRLFCGYWKQFRSFFIHSVLNWANSEILSDFRREAAWCRRQRQWSRLLVLSTIFCGPTEWAHENGKNFKNRKKFFSPINWNRCGGGVKYFEKIKTNFKTELPPFVFMSR